jgi:hypothetical protein
MVVQVKTEGIVFGAVSPMPDREENFNGLLHVLIVVHSDFVTLPSAFEYITFLISTLHRHLAIKISGSFINIQRLLAVFRSELSLAILKALHFDRG